LKVVGGLGVAKTVFAADMSSGSVNITDNTNSTDKDTGALIVTTGGAGIELNLNVGGVTKVWDDTNATDTTTGALQVVGGLGVAKTIFAADMSSGSVIVTDNTTSDSATTGALKVTGGVSTQENLNVGGVTKVWNATDATTTTSGALKVVGGLGVEKTIFAADLSSGSVDVTDTTISDSATTGALQVAGGVGVANNVHVGNDVYIGSNLNVDTTTLHVDSVSNRVGIGKTNPGFTLDVAGDINFSGDLYEGGSQFISSPWEIESSPTALSYEDGNVGIGAANPDSKLYVTGNAYVTTNVHASNVYIAGGLITNTDQVRKKTYSYSGDLSTVNTTEATIKINFTNHVFYAKIVAHLVEGTASEVSTITFECSGGDWNGGTPSKNIGLGGVSVFGNSTANPWDSSVTTAATSVSFKPTETMASAGNYNVFIEYISQSGSGVVSTIEEGTGGAVITFNY